MGKEKIKSISHNQKVWNIRVSSTSKSINYINKILTKLDPQNLRLSGTYLDNWCDFCDQCENNKPHKFSLNYKWWRNNSLHFYFDEDAGYIFFMEDRVEILLLKDSKLFYKLRDEFLRYFEIVKPKIKGKH